MGMILSSKVRKKSIFNASLLTIGGCFAFYFYYLAFTDSSIQTMMGAIATLMLVLMFAGLYQLAVYFKRPDFEIWPDKIIFAEDAKPSLKTKSFNIPVKNIDYIEQDIDVFIVVTKDGIRNDIPHWDLFFMKTDEIVNAFKKIDLKINYIESE